jgi:hypothetical protein
MSEVLYQAGKKGKCEHCGRGESFHTDSADGQGYACDPNAIKSHARNVKRRGASRERYAATKDAYESLGMKRVRGSLGSTYFE